MVVVNLTVDGAAVQRGLRFVEDIREDHPDLPIVVVAEGFRDPEPLRRAVELNVQEYLLRESGLDRISARVARILNRPMFSEERLTKFLQSKGLLAEFRAWNG